MTASEAANRLETERQKLMLRIQQSQPHGGIDDDDFDRLNYFEILEANRLCEAFALGAGALQETAKR